MVVWIRMRNITTLAVGTAAGLFAYYYQHFQKKQSVVNNSWTNSNVQLSETALWNVDWDCREPHSLVRPLKNETPQEQNRYNIDLESMRTTATRHIILVRHGEYLDTGEKDVTHHLTDRGKKQSKYTGKRLKELDIKWEKIVVSTMTRAQETADVLLKEIDYNPKVIKHCSFIREGAPIPPQPPVGHWRPEKSFYRDGARIEAGFRKYFHRAYPSEKGETYTLIVGHGNVIRYFVCRALQFPAEAWLRMNINHGSITWLTINPSGNVSIRYLGDTGFMPPKYLTNRIPRETKSV
ncbi:serine/threonine-protein phosphatase Pgam5, mitochondrial isoform X2 [Teleopsis dalmanni]|uniref:serine/threonine-protein phosphatase Pgam5, mitochondrial isoform X2 n=1 Tax=Teleopsis dalmanni TaxID=139649 RepID=UPI0018CE4F67|nr:serine/threonine-protein phosphatase Pgam5, mitochondrial isoform X2 [Teleopsis dalmanni]